MLLLALDTCTERLIAAVRADIPHAADRWINLDSQGNHARDLLPAIDDLLGGLRPDAIGVAVGPGSFTGVRIGLATAKGLAEGWNVPLVGLKNLEAMADSWTRLVPDSTACVLPAIDARKKKFYGLLWRAGALVLEPSDLSPRDWVEAARRLEAGPVVLTGYQGHLLAEALGADLPDGWSVLPVHDWAPGLLDQLALGWKNGEFLAPDAGPRYLRLSEAEENLRLRSG
jgi:tRNA threonylcarbamoyladenosine biosynthesis protein TsaB